MTTKRLNLMGEVDSTTVPVGHVAFWWIGQAGYIIKTSSGKVAIIDAFVSGGENRMTPPPLEPVEIRCNLYLATHNHLDHLDNKTVDKIPRGNVDIYVGPRNVVSSLNKLGLEKKRIQQVDVGEETCLQGISIRGTFCVPSDESVLDSEGFLITTEDKVSIYHTGDTGFHDFLFYLSKHRVDVMLTCINGGMGNMGIDEAVKLTRLLRPGVVIPNHYGMFEENTVDPKLFRTRLQATGAEPECRILSMGEKFVYP
jgi:L-ascorbate 6-phosphate lactonase